MLIPLRVSCGTGSVEDNVIFVSGTDCYGSPIQEYYRKLVEDGKFKGPIEEFVQFNHDRQHEVLDAYHIDLDLLCGLRAGSC